MKPEAALLWLRQHMGPSLNYEEAIRVIDSALIGPEGSQFFYPDKDSPGFGWLCEMRIENGKRLVHPLDYIRKPDEPQPASRVECAECFEKHASRECLGH